MKNFSRTSLLLITIFSVFTFAQTSKISPEDQAVLDRISSNSLQGHLSFIASDLLEGRDTPSRGQDIAAEYIAAQFRRAGLEPVGDDGYFQTANWVLPEGVSEGFSLTLSRSKMRFKVSLEQISFSSDQAITIQRALLFKVDYSDQKSWEALTEAQVKGKIIFTEIPDYRREERSKWRELFQAMRNFQTKMNALNSAMIVSVDRIETKGNGIGSRRLIDPENRPNASAAQPLLMIHDPKIVKMFDTMKWGSSYARFSLNVPAVNEKPVKLRNVIGLLRGSDPVLKDTYVMVTAHYDHIGIKANCEEKDCINNGANDDGSGTVSVIELANALAARTVKPKRSIIFMTVFGEEKGLLGSRYYGRHPVFPIEKTIADVNLEQVGRTDDSDGSQVNRASMTGFDFSDVGEIFKSAGKLTGITVFKHPQNSDAFFGRSDNQALADQGVPAHTICVAFEYPDYHGLGDHWEKVDYDNMARTNKMVALGLLMIAEKEEAPKWNEANPKTARYVKAWKDRQGK
jgi:Peptidase family M28